jgi:hypothetical protein
MSDASPSTRKAPLPSESKAKNRNLPEVSVNPPGGC